MTTETKVATEFRQLHTAEEVAQAFAAGERVEYTVYGEQFAERCGGDADRIDMPASNLPDSGGWISAFKSGLTHYARQIGGGGMYRARVQP